MPVPKKVVKLLRERDQHCWHCGATEDLVPHHRKNRAMGGSKLLDRIDNLMLVCAVYNGLMESDFRTAALARGWGHKLPVWEDTARPVFDVVGGWWILGADGSKVRLDTSNMF